MFRAPAFMRTMVERGWLGEKAGVGFYRKDGPQILALEGATVHTMIPGEAPRVATATVCCAWCGLWQSVHSECRLAASVPPR